MGVCVLEATISSSWLLSGILSEDKLHRCFLQVYYMASVCFYLSDILYLYGELAAYTGDVRRDLSSNMCNTGRHMVLVLSYWFL